MASTDSATIGLDYGRAAGSKRVRDTGTVQVDEVKIHESNSKIGRSAFTAFPIVSAVVVSRAVTTRIRLPMLDVLVIETVREIQPDRARRGHSVWLRPGPLWCFVDSASAAVEQTNLRELGLPSVLLGGSGAGGRVRRGEMHVRRRVPVVTGYSQTKGV